MPSWTITGSCDPVLGKLYSAREAGCVFAGKYKKFYERDGGGSWEPGLLEKQAELVRTAVPEVVYDPISRILKVEKPGKGAQGVCGSVHREARRIYRWQRKQPRQLNISDAG